MILPAFFLALSTLTYQVASHGYLSSPPPRGIQKTGYQIDDLKSPNAKGLCRGEPAGQITRVTPGQVLRLGFTITAPHIGPCQVSLLDVDLTHETKPFDSKYNCAAPGGPGFWDVKLPSNAKGRKVLRWYWEGRHISTPGEPYEQCIDLDFGGGYAGGEEEQDQAPPAPRPSKPKKKKKRPAKAYKPRPAPRPTPPPPPPPPQYGQDEDESADGGYGDEAPSAPSNHVEGGGGGGGKCEHGVYKCTSGSKYAICNWGQWVNMSCGTGTTCKPNGNSILCG